MNIDIIFTITINEKEAAALQKLLGACSRESNQMIGLTDEQSEMLSKIYNLFPEQD